MHVCNATMGVLEIQEGVYPENVFARTLSGTGPLRTGRVVQVVGLFRGLFVCGLLQYDGTR